MNSKKILLYLKHCYDFLKNHNSVIKVSSFSVSLFFVLSCSINDPIYFNDRFIHIEDEYGGSSSVINWESNNLIKEYSLVYVSSVLSDINVKYEIIVGDGLRENVDFQLIKGEIEGDVTLYKGIYKSAIRIKWLKSPLDETKDNSVTIKLISCDDKDVMLGRPGPDARGNEYIIQKK